jgi:tRNA (cytidine/uridine-2'-O-)-methyltransferase
VLNRPEIPNNTGSIIRLCANTGASLHLVHPLGFELDDKRLRRAGLDYHEWARITHWEDLGEVLEHLGSKQVSCFAMTTKGSSSFFEADLSKDVALVFGSETSGLSDDERGLFDTGFRLRLPMQADSRSMNLANAVSVGVYEAWRQQQFGGAV